MGLLHVQQIFIQRICFIVSQYPFRTTCHNFIFRLNPAQLNIVFLLNNPWKDIVCESNEAIQVSTSDLLRAF